jgi:hypothetical protein
VQLDGTGLAPWRVRIVVYIRTEKARAWVEGRLAGARIPCGLVETVLGGPVQISTITESLGAKAGER